MPQYIIHKLPKTCENLFNVMHEKFCPAILSIGMGKTIKDSWL